MERSAPDKAIVAASQSLQADSCCTIALGPRLPKSFSVLYTTEGSRTEEYCDEHENS
jgi:hypothetical protein